jgi:DNA-binding transcriptional ArsR family regulator
MPVPHPIEPDLAELIAQRFRVLGEPTRIRLLDTLRDGEASVQDLSETLHASQQNVSKHLSLLGDAGIVHRRKEGNRVYYAIADDGIFELCDQVCGSLEQQFAELSRLVGGASR